MSIDEWRRMRNGDEMKKGVFREIRRKVSIK